MTPSEPRIGAVLVSSHLLSSSPHFDIFHTFGAALTHGFTHFVPVLESFRVSLTGLGV